VSSKLYHIEDEPLPTGLARYVVDPLWPLLAVMFVGTMLSWPWFVFNAFALGSPTKRREALAAALGILGLIALLTALLVAETQQILTGLPLRYAVVSLSVCKLAVSYQLYTWQSRPHALWQHFGGMARSGWYPLIVGYLIGNLLDDRLSGFWRVVLR
jgi:hypothetical protein